MGFKPQGKFKLVPILSKEVSFSFKVMAMFLLSLLCFELYL